jgi:hypothetical protein
MAMGAAVARHSVVNRSFDDVRASRRDDDTIGPARELDVPHRRFRGLVPQSVSHRIGGERLKRQRCHEARGVFREHDAHVGTGITQPARELRRLVRGDTAGNTEENMQIR